MILLTIILAVASFIIGVVFGINIFCGRYREGGYVVVDLRRDSIDTVSIHGPKDISKWHTSRGLRFEVEVIPDLPQNYRDA